MDKEFIYDPNVEKLYESDDGVRFKEVQNFNIILYNNIKTNGDRIRAMSDEDLAEWIDKYFENLWGYKSKLEDIVKYIKSEVKE